jgi:hypothetical protein
VAWGDRHYPLLHSYQHLEFHINGKEFYRAEILIRFKKHNRARKKYS